MGVGCAVPSLLVESVQEVATSISVATAINNVRCRWLGGPSVCDRGMSLVIVGGSGWNVELRWGAGCGSPALERAPAPVRGAPGLLFVVVATATPTGTAIVAVVAGARTGHILAGILT